MQFMLPSSINFVYFGRFYGESYPTADMSNANLHYLTSEQALADLAQFVQHLTSFSKGGKSAAYNCILEWCFLIMLQLF